MPSIHPNPIFFQRRRQKGGTYYSRRACSHPGVVASSKRRRAEAALPGGCVHFHVYPASTRPRSPTSLRKHRGRGDISGSSIRSHGRRFSFLGDDRKTDKSELRRNYVKIRSNWITAKCVIRTLEQRIRGGAPCPNLLLFHPGRLNPDFPWRPKGNSDFPLCLLFTSFPQLGPPASTCHKKLRTQYR